MWDFCRAGLSRSLTYAFTVQTLDVLHQAQPPHVALPTVRTLEWILCSVLLQVSVQFRLAERDVVAVEAVKPRPHVLRHVLLERGGVRGSKSTFLAIHHVGRAQHAIQGHVRVPAAHG